MLVSSFYHFALYTTTRCVVPNNTDRIYSKRFFDLLSYSLPLIPDPINGLGTSAHNPYLYDLRNHDICSEENIHIMESLITVTNGTIWLT